MFFHNLFNYFLSFDGEHKNTGTIATLAVFDTTSGIIVHYETKAFIEEKKTFFFVVVCSKCLIFVKSVNQFL
jgi:hypothetical protein